MPSNATSENLRKLARLIAMGQPLQPQAVSEAIVLCAEAWDATQRNRGAAETLARDLIEVATSKCRDPQTPEDGLLGKTYWQGQKDTARRLLAALAVVGAGEEATNDDRWTPEQVFRRNLMGDKEWTCQVCHAFLGAIAWDHSRHSDWCPVAALGIGMDRHAELQRRVEALEVLYREASGESNYEMETSITAQLAAMAASPTEPQP